MSGRRNATPAARRKLHYVFSAAEEQITDEMQERSGTVYLPLPSILSLPGGLMGLDHANAYVIGRRGRFRLGTKGRVRTKYYTKSAPSRTISILLQWLRTDFHARRRFSKKLER